MKKPFLCLACLCLAAATVFGQTSRRYLVSPPGAEFEEGLAASAVQFGFNNIHIQSRTQQIDNSFVGTNVPFMFQGIGWRRDGRSRPSSIKRTAELEMVMSHADFAAVGPNFAKNYKDVPRPVFTRKKVILPDWSRAPKIAPASFDLILPFDIFFIYNRKDAMLYELVVRNLSSPQAYHMDFYRDNQLNHAFADWPAPIDAGCQMSRGRMLQSCLLRVSGSTLEMMFRLWNTPASTPVHALLGTTDPRINLPGLCATLHSNSLVTLPVRTSTAAGLVDPTKVASVPWKSWYGGATLYTQCVALHPSLPYGVALSSAQGCVVPKTNTRKTLPTHMVWNYRSAAATGGFFDRSTCIPTLFVW